MTDHSKRPAPDDWRRRGQERFLGGVLLVARTYRPHRPDWDHDHCEFCWANFSDREGDLNYGYATDDAYRWVCASCFTDFRDEFGWSVVDDSGDLAANG